MKEEDMSLMCPRGTLLENTDGRCTSNYLLFGWGEREYRGFLCFPFVAPMFVISPLRTLI